jgi:hypothetical protein
MDEKLTDVELGPEANTILRCIGHNLAPPSSGKTLPAAETDASAVKYLDVFCPRNGSTANKIVLGQGRLNFNANK